MTKVELKLVIYLIQIYPIPIPLKLLHKRAKTRGRGPACARTTPAAAVAAATLWWPGARHENLSNKTRQLILLILGEVGTERGGSKEGGELEAGSLVGPCTGPKISTMKRLYRKVIGLAPG